MSKKPPDPIDAILASGQEIPAAPIRGPFGHVTSRQVAEIKRLVAEQMYRRCEAARIYDPLPDQLAFHQSHASRRAVVGGNRGGKTLCGAMELAWAVLGTHPYHEYPKENGRAYVIAKSVKHIGEVLYRKLFRAGAFKIIRDKETKEWRAYRPLDPEDLARESEVKSAPPLIPARAIKETAWENKRLNVPSLVRLHNGWEISFFTSASAPIQGVDIDLCWMDEEITHPEWLPEMLLRLVDRRGRFYWTATPQSGTEQFLMLLEEADKEAASVAHLPKKPTPKIQKFSLPFWTNRFLGEREKRTIIDDPTLTDEDRRVRLDGQPAAYRYLMFPEFSTEIHCVESSDPKPEWTEEPYSYLPRGEVPKDWCRYLVIDPGSVVCAVLFAAVPPGSIGDYVYLYDELYINDCSAQKLADEVKRKTEHDFFEAFIIDAHGSARSEHATGLTVKRSYYNAFKKAGIKSRRTGHSFIDGCDDKQARCDMVRDWLRVRGDGTAKLRVLRQKLPNFIEEIKRYKRKRKLDPRTGMKEVIDEPDDSRNAHLMACSQYLAAYQPTYHAPPKARGPQTWAQRRLEERRKKNKRRGKKSFINLGP